MTEVICTSGHVVDQGASHCQRCNVPIISLNQNTSMEDEKQENVEATTEETSTDESSSGTPVEGISTTDTVTTTDTTPIA